MREMTNVTCGRCGKAHQLEAKWNLASEGSEVTCLECIDLLDAGLLEEAED